MRIGLPLMVAHTRRWRKHCDPLKRSMRPSAPRAHAAWDTAGRLFCLLPSPTCKQSQQRGVKECRAAPVAAAAAHGHGGPSLRQNGALPLVPNTPYFALSALDMLKASLTREDCRRL